MELKEKNITQLAMPIRRRFILHLQSGWNRYATHKVTDFSEADKTSGIADVELPI